MEGLDAVLNAGSALGDAKAVPHGVIPYAVIPEGATVEELERLMPSPARARATVTAKSAETFSAYVNRFKEPATAVFADQEKFTLVGIIDYHALGEPGWREHRVSYGAPRSLEWQTWRTNSGKRMGQADFAQFIEDNVVDIRDPDGAAVLEVSRNLQAKKAVDFSSSLRLSDGAQQFSYSETVDGSTVKGTIKVPEEFTLGIPVFFGGIMYEVRARLRYRIESGKLQLWYDLYRPEHIEKDAFAEVCSAIGTATAIEIWEGVP
jgi:uncharacterized protein YfdQ (DUF2303 family)